MVEPRDLQPGEWLTQAGDKYANGGYNFPHRLRAGHEELSLWIGCLTPEEACDRRSGMGKRSKNRDSCRRTTVQRLQELHFRVEHTPDDVNSDHVSAYWTGDSWDDEAAELVCRAFYAPRPDHEGGPDG
jgi:hypothetical protein